MYARGFSNQNIYEEMQKLYGVKVSPDMVTAITDKIIPEIREWQKRQLDEQYAIKSLNNCYKKLNRGRRVFPTGQALEKSMYLSTKIITEKWTSRYQNWGVTLSELHTYFPDRVDIN